MKEKIVYLDSSAVIKRYVRESGSERIRDLYRSTYLGNTVLVFSLWNIGEILGVLDKAQRLQRISEEQHSEAIGRFAEETARLRKIGRLRLIPVTERILETSWNFITSQHIYAVDAVQIVSAAESKCDEFLTGDRKLHSVSLSSGLNSQYVE